MIRIVILIVQEFDLEITFLIIAMNVMLILIMTVSRIVLLNGVVQLRC